MLARALRHYRAMVLAGVFFFWLGCGLTLSLLRLECAGAARGARAGSAPEPPAAPDLLEPPGPLEPLARIEYVVLVLSAPDNADKRRAVRETWGRLVDSEARRAVRNETRAARAVSSDLVKVLFSVGTHMLSKENTTKIQEEHRQTNDLLILENFEDKYERLAGKVLESIKWLNVHVEHLKYVIKCDDDSFVLIDLIVNELEANGLNINVPQQRKHNTESGYKGLYWGFFNGHAHVFTSGKFNEERWFLCDRYLPYALGGGYVVSRYIVTYIANNADMLMQYNSEDVSMGVWTAALGPINRVHDIRFDTVWVSDGCRNDMLIRHKQSPKDMIQMYATLVDSKGKFLCKTESLKVKPYKYNWNVLPSKCCK